MMKTTVESVKEFWNQNPLWTGEYSGDVGSKDFFESHRKTIIEDCFAGELDERTMPSQRQKRKVLDLGCGIGFWSIELFHFGCEAVVGADLSEKSLELAKKRTTIYNCNVHFKVENAENLSFGDETFSHVNCQGVIHHTPNTDRCVSEIARILEEGGTASISVYNKNIFLKYWWLFRHLGLFLSKLGAGLSGRGREKIFEIRDVNELVRFYDGAENPVGKCYSRSEFEEMLAPYFKIEEIFYHFFPARSLPMKIPPFLHKFLDKYLGLMIYANVKKAKKH